jgi:hypothetical protein
LSNLIDGISLNGETDVHSMRFGVYKNFLVKTCYYAMNYEVVTVLGNTDFWSSLAPKNVRSLHGWSSIIDLI